MGDLALILACLLLLNGIYVYSENVQNIGTQPCGNCTCSGNLTIANCSNKKLKNLPLNLPSGITELDLSQNDIGAESLGVMCSQYKKLVKVSLSQNDISHLSSIFSECKNLVELNLRGNKLDYVDQEAFQGLSSLQELSWLEVGDLQPGSFKDLTSLENLNLIYGGLAIKQGVFNELSELKKLHLTLLKVLTPPDQLFDFAGKYTLTILKLNGPKVKEISPSLLINLDKLEHLHLDLPQLLFLKLDAERKPKNLKTLEIFNVLNIAEDTLYGLELLEIVRLRNIQEVADQNIFSEANSLKELEIMGCSLPQIPESWLTNLTSLEMLNLESNGLEMLSADDFTQLTSLKHLVLSNNKLKELPKNVMRPMRASLVQLLLKGNRLEHLEPSAFADMEKLQVLDLSENVLKRIPTSAFQNLPELMIVRLEGNYLVSLGDNLFDSAPKLEELNLSNNMFSVFPEAVLSSSVAKLTLFSNMLITLPAAKLCEMPNLLLLSVADNSIHCDCPVQNLATCSNIEVTGICSTPPFVGQEIKDFTGCILTTTPRSTTSFMPIQKLMPSSAKVETVLITSNPQVVNIVRKTTAGRSVKHEATMDDEKEIMRSLIDIDRKPQDIQLLTHPVIFKHEEERVAKGDTTPPSTEFTPAESKDITNIEQGPISYEKGTTESEEGNEIPDIHEAIAMPAKINEDKGDNTGYLSQSVTVAVALASCIVMIGLMTAGVWLCRRNLQSGSYSAVSTSAQGSQDQVAIQMQPLQQPNPVHNQKRSNVTRDAQY